MKPNAVVEDFDVFEDRALGLDSGGERTSVDELDLQRVPKAFDHCVIVTIATTALACGDAIVVKRLALGVSVQPPELADAHLRQMIFDLTSEPS